MFVAGRKDPTGRVPPGQRVTEKFPVMTAGDPTVADAADWDLALSIETTDGAVREIARWDYDAFSALPQREIVCDIHCVTRWSKLDTRWRGVAIEDLLKVADVAHDDRQVLINPRDDAGDLPIAYVNAQCDGDYAANLRLADLLGDNGFIGLSFDAGDGFAPLAKSHGGPARLVAPRLYFWKSAKWVRRLTLTPFDRKGFWEKLGYHNYGDPWREQRYRGLSDADHRTTLDTALSQQIRRERLKRKRGSD